MCMEMWVSHWHLISRHNLDFGNAMTVEFDNLELEVIVFYHLGLSNMRIFKNVKKV